MERHWVGEKEEKVVKFVICGITDKYPEIFPKESKKPLRRRLSIYTTKISGFYSSVWHIFKNQKPNRPSLSPLPSFTISAQILHKECDILAEWTC
jgi:hypothetical protein